MLELGMVGNFELIKYQNFERPLQISLKTNGSKNMQFMIRNIVFHYIENYSEEISLVETPNPHSFILQLKW